MASHVGGHQRAAAEEALGGPIGRRRHDDMTLHVMCCWLAAGTADDVFSRVTKLLLPKLLTTG